MIPFRSRRLNRLNPAALMVDNTRQLVIVKGLMALRKQISLILLLILLLGMFVGGVQATPVAELTTLARYAPQDSTVFIAIRTDDAYIQALDSLLADLNARTGGQMLPRDFTLRNALNELFTDMSDIPNGFDSAIRPWLGDTAAIILPTGIDLSGNTEPAVLLAASVANRGAAMFFLNLAFTGVSPEQGPGGTLIYAAPGAPFSAALTEDALLLAENRANLELAVFPNEDAAKLTTHSGFQATIDALPAGDYNIVAYANLTSLIAEVGVMLDEGLAEMGLPGDDLNIQDLLNQAGYLGAGLTILNGRSLTADLALVPTDAPTGAVSAGVDQDLLARVPSSAALVILDDGLGDRISGLLGFVEQLSDMLETSGTMDEMLGDAPAALRGLRLRDFVTFIRLSFRGTLGLDLDETLGWMNGSFALHLSGTSDGGNLVLNPGFVMALDESARAGDLVGAIAGLMTDSFATATYEDNVLTMPATLYNRRADASHDFLLAHTSDLLVAGTRPSVEFALDPSGNSLLDNAAFLDEQAIFLDDATAIWFINVQSLRLTLVDFLRNNPLVRGQVSRSDLEMIDTLLSVPQSAAISAAQTSNGAQLLRLTLTLTAQ